MKYSEEIVRRIIKLSEGGLTSRHIAQLLLGSSTKKSTVNNILKMNRMESDEKVFEKSDNSRILFISDLHIPFHHKDVFKFLRHLKEKYKPTRVICLGDELDKHCLSYHESDPDGYSAGHELEASLPHIKELESIFPVMDIVESNHGSLHLRKAKTYGIPKRYIKTYNEILGVGEGWKWHYDITLELPNGQQCYVHHGKSSDVLKLSQQMGMNAVQGHYHSVFKVDWWANPKDLYWGLQCGCLIDRESYAFSYENVNIKKPIVGTGLVIDSVPILEPMLLDKNGRWVHK